MAESSNEGEDMETKHDRLRFHTLSRDGRAQWTFPFGRPWGRRSNKTFGIGAEEIVIRVIAQRIRKKGSQPVTSSRESGPT